jgi:hypothetical protein
MRLGDLWFLLTGRLGYRLAGTRKSYQGLFEVAFQGAKRSVGFESCRSKERFEGGWNVFTF